MLGVGDVVAGCSLVGWGGSVPMTEKRQRRRCPDWSVLMFGWHSIVVVGGMSVKLRIWLVVWEECGAWGAQQ